MKKLARTSAALCGLSMVGMTALPAKELARIQARIATGVIEGVESADGLVRTFKGIPYAAPPVGPLRWKPPQPAAAWEGVRQCVDYGPRPMQVHIWDDMIHHDPGPSEDCLYLNVWYPAKPATAKLPVMVWIYGGGFKAGSGSEARQDGGNLCKEGVVVVNLNYRLDIFGFLALPELTTESPQHASGNYGLLDMVAALQWVHDNIAVFGGDPDNVTIFGQSAGSTSVCGLMASPLSRGLVHKAIGMSASYFDGRRKIPSLATAEKRGLDFVKNALGTTSLKKLRAMPAEELMKASADAPEAVLSECVDGWFMPAPVASIFAAGRQAHIPLLAGWTLDEAGSDDYFKGAPKTLENFRSIAQTRFGGNGARFLATYAAESDEEAERAAADFETDRSQGFRTWRWLEAQRATGGSPVYRYKFEQPTPLPPDAPPGSVPRAHHSSDIEFVFRVLSSKKLPWSDEDRAVSETIATYFTNFAKHGDPNGPGLPDWPRYTRDAGDPVMHLRAHAAAAPDAHRARCEFLDSLDTMP